MTSVKQGDSAAPDLDPFLTGQSLAKGAAGLALLHIEHALSEPCAWPVAHAWMTAATCGPVIASDQAGLFYGAPAISFLAHAAQADGVRRYGSVAETLDQIVTRAAERRLAAASERLDRGQAATFAEYDLFYGLTGLAVLFLKCMPASPVLPAILRYLVRLTEPWPDGRPGWWVSHDPDPLLPTPGGHAGFGMAHGAAGILALLSRSAALGHLVEYQYDAIDRLCDWFDRWRQSSGGGHWWPQWITARELAVGHIVRVAPPRPSWCYGAVGICLGDTGRRLWTEQALAACLANPGPLELITDPGLCHGLAGVYQTAWRASRDSLTPAISERLPALASPLLKHAEPALATGLLDGAVGIALAIRTATCPDSAPKTGWDTCLLIG